MTGYAMWLAGIILQTARIYSGAPGKVLGGGLQSGRTANLYCLTISLAVKPDCITLTGSFA